MKKFASQGRASIAATHCLLVLSISMLSAQLAVALPVRQGSAAGDKSGATAPQAAGAAVPTPPSGKPTKPDGTGSAKSAPSVTVEFTHKGCAAINGECRLSYSLDLSDGEAFTIKIDSTVFAAFTFDVAGYVAQATSRISAQAVEYNDTSFLQRHDKKYGGYVVSIRHKNGDQTLSKLPDATLMISVRTRTWAVAFAGGFSLSRLHDLVFSLRDTTVGGAARHVVTQQSDHEDSFNPGTASFVHLYKTTFPSLAASFGLGIGGSGTTYYFGPSWRFGDVGALTVGAVVGQRKELPNGAYPGQVSDDPNLLTNMASRYRSAFFFAFSYSFINTGAADLQKPFQGGNAPAAPAASGTAPTTASKPVTPPDSKNTVTSPTTGVVGTALTFRLTLANAPADGFKAGTVSISASGGETGSNLTGIDPTCTLTPSQDAKSATCSFKATPAAAAAGKTVTPVFTIIVTGSDGVDVTGIPINVAGKP